MERCHNCKFEKCIGCEIMYSDIEAICNTDQWYIDKIRELNEKVSSYHKQLDLDYVDKNFVSKTKIRNVISKFKSIRDEILKLEKELNRSMISYDLIRNDYCIKILKDLLEE